MLSPLPPVEQLRPGLWSIPVPMPNSSLRYVFVYAFESSGGVYIIDVGWNTDDAYGALVGGLGTAGFAITDVKGMLVTHIHPDHYGLAGRVREASGAWVALHPADAKLIQDRYDEPEHLLGRVSSFLRRLGAPEAEVAALTTSAMPVRGYVDVAGGPRNEDVGQARRHVCAEERDTHGAAQTSGELDKRRRDADDATFDSVLSNDDE